MSTCISNHGEFGSHDLDADYVCQRCYTLDEDALIEELHTQRAAASHLSAPHTLDDCRAAVARADGVGVDVRFDLDGMTEERLREIILRVLRDAEVGKVE